jgi:hypothetical protein
MSVEMVGLMALGVLNLALGVLIGFVCLRLAAMNKLIIDVEGRISRLEILTSLADSRESKVEKATKQKAGGTT